MTYPADAISWEAAGSVIQPFKLWSSAKKKELKKTVKDIRSGQFPGLSATPPLKTVLNDNDPPYTVLEEDIAWQYYIAYVAQSLAIQPPYNKPPLPGALQWRLIDYSLPELYLLFDSRSLFRWDDAMQGYIIRSFLVTPGDPVRTAQFLYDNNLVGNTPFDTIGNLLDWCRAHLLHNSVPQTVAGARDQWQYEGWPPVESIISGTSKTSDPKNGVKHVVYGCWGFTGFVSILLRTVNIPVDLLGTKTTSGVHATPRFIDATNAAYHQSFYLCHGDNAYTDRQYNVATDLNGKPNFPTSELFIDKSRLDTLFAASLSLDQKDFNLFQRDVEVAAQHLSNYLLQQYRQDVKNNPKLSEKPDELITQKDSPLVCAMLFPNLTIEDLRKMKLWSRMHDRVFNYFGGFSKIPPWDLGLGHA